MALKYIWLKNKALHHQNLTEEVQSDIGLFQARFQDIEKKNCDKTAWGWGGMGGGGGAEGGAGDSLGTD